MMLCVSDIDVVAGGIGIVEVACDEIDVLVNVNETTFAIAVEEIDVAVDVTERVVELSLTGSPGPPGTPGTDARFVTKTADGAIGGHRVVVDYGVAGVSYADATDPDHVVRVLGVTTHAAADAEPVQVQVFGDITEPSWNWNVSVPDVFLGTNGQLTQVDPALTSAVFVLRVGVAITPTTMRIDFHDPVTR